LYINDVADETTTVDAFGNWTVTGLSLSTGEVLSATALAPGKTISGYSNEIEVIATVLDPPEITTTTIVPSLGSVLINVNSILGDSTSVFADGEYLGNASS